MDIPPEELRERDARERVMLETLQAKSALLARIYSGAVAALRDRQNADGVALAAHNLRELMDRFSEEVDIQTPKAPPNLKGEVHNLHGRWTRMMASTESCCDGQWGERLDGPLGAFLRYAQEFFERFAVSHVQRAQVVAVLLIELDGRRERLPPPLQDHNVEYWQQLHDQFTKLAHHRGEMELEEFLEWRYALEDFLLNLLRPRTFADQAEMDAILEESDANT